MPDFSCLWYITPWNSSQRLRVDFMHFVWFPSYLLINWSIRIIYKFIRIYSQIFSWNCWTLIMLLSCNMLILLQHLFDHRWMWANICIPNSLIFLNLNLLVFMTYQRKNCVSILWALIYLTLPWFGEILSLDCLRWNGILTIISVLLLWISTWNHPSFWI